MISWMQKNNKFLIVTIWIATISFIFTGATYGFSFGIKSSSIGRVGEIELSRDRFQMEYRNLYNRYNQMFQGKFDEEQAKKMRLQEQVLNSMAGQAKILNLAKEFGIVVSKEEIAKSLANIPSFQKNGVFNRSIYDNYIKNSGVSTKTFESSLKDSLMIEKTFKMLNLEGTVGEYEALATPFEIADKLKYITISKDDINITVDESRLKEFWESRKEQYKTKKAYTFDVVWIDTKDVAVSDAEIEEQFKNNGFSYTSEDGKRLLLDEAKEQVVVDVKLKKSKKGANLKYIEFKKGKIKKSETITYAVDDLTLSNKLWSEIKMKSKGDILKPKVIKDRYAILKVVEIKNPIVKTFEEAREIVTPLYKQNMLRDSLAKLAEEKLTNIDKENTELSDYITLKNIKEQKLGLNQQENADFATKLFTSNQEKGIISIGDRVVVYKIIEQKLILLDKNSTKDLELNVNQLKAQTFESNLLKRLDKKYPTEFYK